MIINDLMEEKEKLEEKLILCRYLSKMKNWRQNNDILTPETPLKAMTSLARRNLVADLAHRNMGSKLVIDGWLGYEYNKKDRFYMIYLLYPF